MRSISLLFFLLLLLQNTINGQTLTYGPTPAYFVDLLKTNEQIRTNDVLNEQLLDLVDVYTLDSTYKRKTERHQMFGAAMFRAFGVRWKTVDYTRERFIGTIKKISISGKEHFTEYDVNFDPVPHLPKYQALSYYAYQAQAAMFKARKKMKEKDGQAPYIEPTGLSEDQLKKYSFHCENTPLREARSFLDEAFYPAVRGTNHKIHPNFGEMHPSIGVYGPLVLDCNHKCHPEIHPYEWLWWMNVGPQLDNSNTKKIWWVGLLRDVSKRMKHWSYSPRTGEIAVPFALPVNDADTLELAVLHLFFNGFDAEGFVRLKTPANAYSFNETVKDHTITISGVGNKIIRVTSSVPIYDEGLKYWLKDLNYDASAKLLTGRLNLAMSVYDIYTAMVGVSYK